MHIVYFKFCLYMFRYLFLLLMLLTASLGSYAIEKQQLDGIFNQLDATLEESPQFVKEKEARMLSLRKSLDGISNPNSRYGINMKLYEEYRSYKNDSALLILQANIRLARQMKRTDLETECLSLLAYQCSSGGNYADAKATLAKVDKSKLRGKGLFYYYRAQFELYSEMSYYARLQDVKDSAKAIAAAYEVQLLKVIDKKSPEYKQYLCRHILFINHNLNGALKVCNDWIAMTPENSHGFALAAYYKYLIYMMMGKHDDAIYWAARSAINDISLAVMDQASLWGIADYINASDVDRAYRYIKYSWRCVSTFGTAVRAAQVGPILSVIESEYKAELDTANHRLVVITVLIAVLAVVLLFMLYYANRQRHKLAAARNDLHQRNSELADANKRLSDSNGMLQRANERISAGNAQLKEADQIKEAYIGRFLALCSDYVNRMDKARKNANRLIKTHKIDELYQKTNSSEQKDKDLEELYGYFDSTFLNIFPSFVDDFNALLKPENRVEVPARKLNTTLRIFALIRLGIDDSGKIADFLGYSVNTIYNYRARTKNGCIGSRDTFEDDVKNLGKIS